MICRSNEIFFVTLHAERTRFLNRYENDNEKTNAVCIDCRWRDDGDGDGCL